MKLRSTISARLAWVALTTLGAAVTPATPAALTHAHRRAHRAAAQCAHADTPASSASTDEMRGAVLCLINLQRRSHGLPALQVSWRLDRSAQGWTEAMIASRSFTHGSDFGARISAAGFAWQAAAENIATGYPTPAAVVGAWMASAGHCENILSPTYSYVGTGIVRRPVGSYATGGATWTQDFALPRGAHAPSSNGAPARDCPH